MRKTITAIAAACLVLALSSCQAPTSGDLPIESQTSSEPATKDEKSAVDAVKIEDIDWSVDQGVVSGTRRIVFQYTNNSSYDILSLRLEFQQRDDVTDEDRAILNSIYERYPDWGDINGGLDEVYIAEEGDKLLSPGETSNPIPCTFNTTGVAVESMDQYALMEPSIMTIAYIDDGYINIEYYDYVADTYSLDSKSGIKADAWPDEGITDVLPKPESDVIVETYSSEDSFNASVVASEDVFESYVSACKEAGFTEDQSEGSSSYDASDAAGNSIQIYYNAEDETMRISFDAAQREE